MKNQFEKAQERGLNNEQERKLNVIRGCVLGSFLENPQKKEICEFIQELEDFFGEEETEDEE